MYIPERRLAKRAPAESIVGVVILCIILIIVAIAFVTRRHVHLFFKRKNSRPFNQEQQPPRPPQRVATYQPRQVSQTQFQTQSQTLDGLQPVSTPPPKYEPPPPPYPAHLRDEL